MVINPDGMRIVTNDQAETRVDLFGTTTQVNLFEATTLLEKQVIHHMDKFDEAFIEPTGPPGKAISKIFSSKGEGADYYFEHKLPGIDSLLPGFGTQTLIAIISKFADEVANADNSVSKKLLFSLGVFFGTVALVLVQIPTLIPLIIIVPLAINPFTAVPLSLLIGFIHIKLHPDQVIADINELSGEFGAQHIRTVLDMCMKSQEVDRMVNGRLEKKTVYSLAIGHEQDLAMVLRIGDLLEDFLKNIELKFPHTYRDLNFYNHLKQLKNNIELLHTQFKERTELHLGAVEE